MATQTRKKTTAKASRGPITRIIALVMAVLILGGVLVSAVFANSY